MNPNTSNVPLARRFAVVVIAALLGVAQPSQAQSGRRMLFAEAFRPDVMQRDLSLMTQRLQLEEWQQPVVEALIIDYTTAFNTGVDALKDRMRAASEDAVRAGTQSGEQVLQRVLEPLGGWRSEKERMLAKFTNDVKSQLGQQQLERWPSFERALRRERLLPEGDLSGERVALFAVLARMQPTPAEERDVAPVLAQYEETLDRALAARTQRSREVLPRLEAAMAAMDYERMGDLQDEVMQSCVAVRDANDAAIQALAAALGSRGADFRRAALEQAYPEPYRIHPVMVLMQQVRGLASLTPEQAAQVDALIAEFGVACDAANEKVAAVVRTEEPKAAKRRARAMMERKSGGAGSSPGSAAEDETAKAMAEKRAMGEPYRERLMAILTPEQAREVNGPSPEEVEREKLQSLGLEPKQFASPEDATDEVDPSMPDQLGTSKPADVPPPGKAEPGERRRDGQKGKSRDPSGKGSPTGGGEPR